MYVCIYVGRYVCNYVCMYVRMYLFIYLWMLCCYAFCWTSASPCPIQVCDKHDVDLAAVARWCWLLLESKLNFEGRTWHDDAVWPCSVRLSKRPTWAVFHASWLHSLRALLSRFRTAAVHIAGAPKTKRLKNKCLHVCMAWHAMTINCHIIVWPLPSQAIYFSLSFPCLQLCIFFPVCLESQSRSLGRSKVPVAICSLQAKDYELWPDSGKTTSQESQANLVFGQVKPHWHRTRS